jgi:hypothetical protein
MGFNVIEETNKCLFVVIAVSNGLAYIAKEFLQLFSVCSLPFELTHWDACDTRWRPTSATHKVTPRITISTALQVLKTVLRLTG